MSGGTGRTARTGAMLAWAGMVAVAFAPALAFSTRWDGSNAAVKFLALCLGGALALAGTARVLAVARALPRARAGDVAVAAYLAWTAVATVVAPDRLLALSGARPYWDGLVAAVAAGAGYAACRVAFPTAAEASRALRWTLRAAAAAFLVMAAASAAGAAGVPVLRAVAFQGARLGALIHQPTFLAGLIAVWIVPMAAWAMAEWGVRHRSSWAWTAAAAAAAMAVMLAATSGRAGIVGAAIAACCFAALSARSWRARAVRVALVLAAAATVAVPAVLVRGSGAEARGAAEVVGRSAFDARVGAWRAAARAIAAAPLTGTGPGTYLYAHQRYETVEEARLQQTKVLVDPHDWLLAAGVASGVPGAAAALAITACGILAAWRSRGSPRASLAAACGVIGHGVAVLATPNAIVMFPSALLLLAFAETAAPHAGGDAPALARRAVAWAAGTVAVLLGAACAWWGVRIVSAEWSYGTGRAGLDATRLERAMSFAPEVAEYARYAAAAKTAAAKAAGPGSTSFFDAERALLDLAGRHPRDPLALFSAGALVDLAAVARSHGETAYAGRLADEAVPVLERAVEAAPQSGDARLRYAEALLWSGDPAGALLEFRAAQAIGVLDERQEARVRDMLVAAKVM